MTTPTPTPDSIVSSSMHIVKKESEKIELSKKKVVNPISKSNVEVPIFLRKTYHMINTCDPLVASWSDNGETFVVKQPDVFEKKIIPQFFKHNKFSSFVRQLNFYGFRKIKFSDTIKIDAKLEAETANFWRFRHENFLRGKPELLTEIRRSNSQSTVEKSKPTQRRTEDVSVLKTEVSTLKDRISLMSSNIEQLTTLVQKITMNEQSVKDVGVSVQKPQENVVVGNKRKKFDALSPIVPEIVVSSIEPKVEDEMEGVEFTPGSMFPPARPLRQESNGSNISDDAFVDQLFNAFEGNDGLDSLPDPILNDDVIVSDSSVSWEKETPQHPNAPDPQLMNKLSNALTVLPKDVQEMLVNKLINTITSSDALKSHLDAVTSSITDVAEDKKENVITPFSDQTPEIAIPLAAATLTAIISQYSELMKNKSCIKTKRQSLPFIPIHA